ncbi:unnamed protein product [Amoebophrya sp. A25]|nr:unnamed protein product [Amoebophrya sp. A25]|eukprot:GSA25T00019206001.1
MTNSRSINLQTPAPGDALLEEERRRRDGDEIGQVQLQEDYRLSASASGGGRMMNHEIMKQDAVTPSAASKLLSWQRSSKLSTACPGSSTTSIGGTTTLLSKHSGFSSAMRGAFSTVATNTGGRRVDDLPSPIAAPAFGLQEQREEDGANEKVVCPGTVESFDHATATPKRSAHKIRTRPSKTATGWVQQAKQANLPNERNEKVEASRSCRTAIVVVSPSNRAPASSGSERCRGSATFRTYQEGGSSSSTSVVESPSKKQKTDFPAWAWRIDGRSRQTSAVVEKLEEQALQAHQMWTKPPPDDEEIRGERTASLFIDERLDSTAASHLEELQKHCIKRTVAVADEDKVDTSTIYRRSITTSSTSSSHGAKVPAHAWFTLHEELDELPDRNRGEVTRGLASLPPLDSPTTDEGPPIKASISTRGPAPSGSSYTSAGGAASSTTSRSGPETESQGRTASLTLDVGTSEEEQNPSREGARPPFRSWDTAPTSCTTSGRKGKVYVHLRPAVELLPSALHPGREMNVPKYSSAIGAGAQKQGKIDKAPAYLADRFLPSRRGTNLRTGFLVMDEERNKSSSTNIPPETTQDENAKTYANLLRNELLGNLHSSGNTCGSAVGGSSSSGVGGATRHPSEQEIALRRSLFKFKSAPQLRFDDAFSLAPVPFVTDASEQRSQQNRCTRKIARVPYKVLDAPQLQDDFYLNLVDWSSSNCLSVGLSNCVYLWSACTSRVTKLCDLGGEDTVTSVSWTQRGTHLAVGTHSGDVQIWDVAQCRKLRTMGGHHGRVGTMSWNGYVLSTGSRDHNIFHRDVRQQVHYMAKLSGHRQEVCGLKWSYDEQQLASGGNDNKLYVWNLRSTEPVLKFAEHTAAVKAIAWSPHQHGLLCSGGGTADRCIRFYNTINNTNLSCIDTGSQVCNLSWSTSVNELVSTHGYSLNQIILWKYPSMQKVVTLTGHTYRVLYLALSPDGQSICTGAGDETLRFWNVFPSSQSRTASHLTSLPFGTTIR